MLGATTKIYLAPARSAPQTTTPTNTSLELGSSKTGMRGSKGSMAGPSSSVKTNVASGVTPEAKSSNSLVLTDPFHGPNCGKPQEEQQQPEKKKKKQKKEKKEKKKGKKRKRDEMEESNPPPPPPTIAPTPPSSQPTTSSQPTKDKVVLTSVQAVLDVVKAGGCIEQHQLLTRTVMADMAKLIMELTTQNEYIRNQNATLTHLLDTFCGNKTTTAEPPTPISTPKDELAGSATVDDIDINEVMVHFSDEHVNTPVKQ